MGYNWRNTLTDFAAISGVLAGFCIAFIALILGGPVADTEIFSSGVTFGRVAVLLFGISTGLFICAAELFLYAKEFDVFSVPESYRKLLKEDCELKKKDWAKFEDEQTEQCRRNEKLGRRCYNSAIFAMFGGLFFAIAPYNHPIAIIVSGLGIMLESWQILR
jgi:dolichol kinase